MRLRCVLGLCAAVALGCGEGGPAAPTPAAVPAPFAPPIPRFVEPKPWQPKRGAAKPVSPPDLDSLTFYVLVDQYEPHQKQTPTWQALPARESVEVKMPPGSRFRCVAAPLEISPEANDFESAFEEWLLSRSVLCTSDGFRSWSSYSQRVRLRPDGSRSVEQRSDGWLSERASDGTTKSTVLSLRSEMPRMDATQGPPRTISNE